jgi:hypothetical protein
MQNQVVDFDLNMDSSLPSASLNPQTLLRDKKIHLRSTLVAKNLMMPNVY